MKTIITRPVGSTWDGIKNEVTLSVIPREGETIQWRHGFDTFIYVVVKVTWHFRDGGDDPQIVVNLCDHDASAADIATMRRYV